MTPKEREALVKVRDMLASGAIASEQFNMSYDCGTVPPPHVALNDAIGQTRAANEALRILAGRRAAA